MGKRKVEQAFSENSNESPQPKRKRGPYFKWLRNGNSIPASTENSRKKSLMQQVKKAVKKRPAKPKKVNSRNLPKKQIKVPFSPIVSNSQRENSLDGQNICDEISTLAADGRNTVFDEQLSDQQGTICDENSAAWESVAAEQNGQANGNACSLIGLDKTLAASPLLQDATPIVVDETEAEEEIDDPLYELIFESNFINNEVTESNEFDENYDLESLDEDSSSSLHRREELCELPPDHDDSDDNDSDEEEMLAQAPNLHLSQEKKIHLLLLLATKKRHNLSYSASEDIMELSGILSTDETNFIPTRHQMKQAIEMYSNISLSEHHVCPGCGTYVGIVSSPTVECDKCKGEFSTDSNKKNGNMFLYLSLTDQIKSVLKHCHNDIVDPKQRKKICQYNFEDIYDGKVYKESVESDCLTINCFVDGLQVSTTSKRSAWPVLGSINELPLHLRRKYILMASLWLGLKKPNCQEYLKPFTEECNVLRRNGLAVRIGSRSLHYRVKVLMCISDTVARPLLRNSTQFNGDHGCGLCYHPGVGIKFKKGTVHSYSFTHGEYPLRTHDEIMHYARMAENEGKPVMGIKGKSVFSNIVGFNVASGLDLDFFHVLVNVSKRFAYLWFGDRFKSKPYSVFHKFSEVDGRLLKITPTSDVARAPRSLKDRSDFRGHEWFHWVLEYSIPVLKGLLPARYLNHWSTLVHAVAILMQNSVSKSDVGYSIRYLKSFVKDIDHLYGPQHVTISVHLLTHLGESVFNFAQPFTHSAFMYESFNHDIKNFVKSSNGIAQQICKGMQLRVALKNLEDDVKDVMTAEQSNYYKKMTVSGFRAHVEPHFIINDISFLGKPKDLSLSRRYLEPLKEEGVACNTILIYERCLFQSELYHSSTYSRVTRQNNSVVLLDNDKVFCIEYFIVADGKSFILGKILPENKRMKLCDAKLPHILVLHEPEDCIRCFPVDFINCKLLSFKINLSSESVTIACINVLRQEMLR